ncbi:MAG: glycoside hydrolase, partial [Lentisphaerae bacterium]|nr:glycoside hydrolase [Lentisphaerota bacterium]
MKVFRFYIFMLTIFLGWSSSGFAQYADVTARLELLGNPYKELYPDYLTEMIYARNIWDMQAFEGRIYLGAGNSANSPPAKNAGPLPIISYDPGTGEFQDEFVVDDEQIDVFNFLAGRLYVPGHDPRQNWKWGNYYRLEDDGWQKHRNIPDGIHNYAMVLHDGRLFAGLGTINGAAVAVSDDAGRTWRNYPAPGPRVYSFLQCGDELFAVGMLARFSEEQLANLPEERREQSRENYGAGMAQWRDGAFVPRPDLDCDVMIPGLVDEPMSLYGKLVKPVSFNGVAVYIGSRLHNDHQFKPWGLFAADSLDPDDLRVRRLTIDVDAGDPWDLFERDGKLYVLTNSRLACGQYRATVWSSTDLEGWTPLLHFNAATLVRSFELLDDRFYFGLGVELDRSHSYQDCELHPDTGAILRFDPHRSPEARLLGDLARDGGFVKYLAALLDSRNADLRRAGGIILREFTLVHDPLRPDDRDAFLKRLVEIYQDVTGQDDFLRMAAFRILMLHAHCLDAQAPDLVIQGLDDPLESVRAIAATIKAVGFDYDAVRSMLRRLDGRTDADLQHAASAELINRPVTAFPAGRDPGDYEQLAALPLPESGWWFQRDLG